MPNPDHIAQLMKGVTAWNAWRDENPDIRLDLREADLRKADLRKADLRKANLGGLNLSKGKLRWAIVDLSGANLSEANLCGANLFDADLSEANLKGANLSKTNLCGATLTEANLSGANLSKASLSSAHLDGTNLGEANLGEANLSGAHIGEADLSWANLGEADLNAADLRGSNLSGANLRGSNLSGANLWRANLKGANLSGADLQAATLLDTDLTAADLTGCRIYGVSAWRVKLDGAEQRNLIVTPWEEPEITVDNVEVAQFVYLLLHNQKIRDVIDTITSKAVLILGRFTEERKAVLDALREELRKRNYLPILFDFSVPATRDITETVSLLARMARFIIADLTDPSSIPKELEAIVPHLAVPVQPLLEGSSRPYAMFKDYWKYEWVLPPYQYDRLEPLLAALAERVIAPAEAKVKALEERRRVMEA
jgi:uncharacterized protein YjbI with pentapeptide repeats